MTQKDSIKLFIQAFADLYKALFDQIVCKLTLCYSLGKLKHDFINLQPIFD